MALAEFKLSRVIRDGRGVHVVGRIYEGDWASHPETGEPIFVRTKVLATVEERHARGTDDRGVRASLARRIADHTALEPVASQQALIEGEAADTGDRK